MKKLVMLFLAVASPAVIQTASAQNCPPIDRPDFLYQDVNGDGIDGDKSRAVFVSDSLGDDANTGLMSQPVKTLEIAVQIAEVLGKDVYVAKGTYTLNSSITLPSGVSLYGQFDGPPNWGRSAANTTVITGVASPIIALNIDTPTYIDGFHILASDATPAELSSYGIRVSGGNSKLYIRHNLIAAGNGATGADGVDGTNGAAGNNGSVGGNGSCDGSTPGAGGIGGTSPCGRNGGNGGVGGPEGAYSGASGKQGAGGTSGGLGGGGGNPGQVGSVGFEGADGTFGLNGSPATSAVTILGIGYLPNNGSNGTNGAHGNGGGGGGGGGGQGCALCDNGTGNGGGGGGGGGCAGTGGSGGFGGGASFGILVIDATIILENNHITSATGGNGGNGGNGGSGGNGGLGGNGATHCTGEIGPGGKGGNGGKGGAGGSGAGGAGGPSAGIMMHGAAVIYAEENTVLNGTGGMGGNGGNNTILGTAPIGATGLSSAIMGGSTDVLPVAEPEICINDIMILEPASADTQAIFTVYLSEPTSVPVTVEYNTADSTAVAEKDYQSAAGSLTFSAGEIMKQVHVTILRNTTGDGGNKTFILQLSDATSATISKDRGVATIQDVFSSIESYFGSEGLVLHQNYPNPFSNQTEISYNLPAHGKVTLTVTDITGRLINVLADEQQQAGEHNIEFSSRDLFPGFYFYRLNFNDKVITKKMVVR